MDYEINSPILSVSSRYGKWSTNYSRTRRTGKIQRFVHRHNVKDIQVNVPEVVRQSVWITCRVTDNGYKIHLVVVGIKFRTSLLIPCSEWPAILSTRTCSSGLSLATLLRTGILYWERRTSRLICNWVEVMPASPQIISLLVYVSP